MANNNAVRGIEKTSYTVTVLDDNSAGEILTLQRAAYVTEAIAHRDLDLPPLTQTIEELRVELASPDVLALGVREQGRLLGAVRLHRMGNSVELGRLTVAPDRQGQGIGSFLLREAESAFSQAIEIKLFIGFSEIFEGI